MPLDKSVTLKFYKRRDVQDAIVEHAIDKEIGVRYGDGFGKRPDIIKYPREVLELTLRGTTSFHSSEERWSNPLAISSNLSREDLTKLRIAWDLVLDIDCAVFEYSRICAYLVIEFLKYCGVKDHSVKFSGNKGFHIGVPFEAFPKQVGNQKTREMFPDAARKIAAYVTENIKEELARKIMEFENGNFNAIREKTNSEKNDIIYYKKDKMGTPIPMLKVDPFLEIDTILIASRHLYRMPYSLHEKSGLASLPFDPEKVLQFEKTMAHPDTIKVSSHKFLDREVSGESAQRLLAQALDFEVKITEDREPEKKYEEVEITSPITEEFFPPCVKNILSGVADGKKRAIFILSNFLGKIGWNKDEIAAFLKEWNKKNPEPLREVYIKGQMYSFKAGEKLPPNCDNEGYAKGIGVCQPDHLCSRIKNPVNYTLLKWKRHLRMKEEEEGKEKKEEN
ncbi:hypothetical protein COV20_01425 [Candidatus Woesearchaeota archaeon CG10_big_fil_rev_8_21_14_0_10_45_16]|nr:MAG: hypothetical protein COV20_01425 [Candidatus Woesearchaeota archaeon CG10_big_fil_rev_8_21_14_0_10_45_16]